MRRSGVTVTACDRTEAGNETYQKKNHRIRSRYAKEEIRIECKADRGKAIVRICDDGEGIAPELLPHIFDRFFSTRKGGAGIGLSLAKEIVSLHKGTITASNDGGAVFEISLPLRKTI